MDPSSSDLEFFDFKNSSDEEIKEIQAILKGPGSNGCVELPWEISVKSNYTGSLLGNEGTALETVPESTKSSNDAAQTLSFVTPQTSLPPVAQLPPPAVETFVSLPTTVGPYQNAPYFVSRTIPYLRYPPMGVPFFACPMPGTGEVNPYAQFVPMVPEKPLDSEPNPKSRDRQSNRKNSRKRLSEGSENVNVYPEGAPTTSCPTSVPLVPLPPSTFVGGNLPLGYPPGLHTLQASSPAMYYVPVFNHHYGGYLPPSGPPMMLPVNVAPELKCSSLVTDGNGGPEEVLPTDNGGLEELPQANSGGLAQVGNDGPGESPLTTSNGGTEESFQTDYNGKANPADNGCTHELLQADNSSSDQVLQTYSPVEETTPNVQSNCAVSNIVDAQPVHPTAKTEFPEAKERMDSSDSLSGPVSEVSYTNCFQETEKRLEETVSSKVPLVEMVTPESKTVPMEAKACRPATEKVKQVVREQSRCWADLFKGPSHEMNGFETTPIQRHGKKTTLNHNKRDITNGKVYSVPASNSYH